MMTHPSPPTATSGRWAVMLLTVLAVFMAVLDTTIVNIALADLATRFSTDIGGIQWVLAGYLVAVGLVIPGSGYIADRYGSKRTFITAVIVFTLASALCGAAPTLETLIAARVLQGIGGGAIIPIAFAMFLRVVPVEQRGRYMGMIGIPIFLAPALGPLIGGYLVEAQSWRWIFFVNIPIGVLITVGALRWLREERSGATDRFDVWGLILSGTGLAALLYAVSEAPDRGWADPATIALLAGGMVALAAFVVVELRLPAPLLDLSLFRDRFFLVGNGVLWLGSLGLFGGYLLLPLFLQQLQGRSPFETGLILLPQGLGLLVAAPLSGILYDRYGARWLVVIGVVLLSGSTAVLFGLTAETSGWELAPVLLARGLGAALVLNPAQTAALANIGGAAMARASSMTNALRQLAAAIGVALTATLLQARVAAQTGDDALPRTSPVELEQAYQEIFLITAVALLPAIAAAVLLPALPPGAQPQPDEGRA